MPHPQPPPQKVFSRQPIDVPALAAAIRAGDRGALGRGITLIEGRVPAHGLAAEQLIERILPYTGKALRIGISGVPGAGKSTLIETFGRQLTEHNHRLAVLAIDPSSTVTGGSILGDKTRMQELARDERAFVRPSPSAGTLGGVARRSRETMLLCEAAGYDVIIVETVGVGQSEAVVSDMVDTFVVLMLAGAGDELQGIKRGVLELADLLAVNKADVGDGKAAERCRRDLATALHLTGRGDDTWRPEVLGISGLTGLGLEELWASIQGHRKALEDSGALEQRRGAQAQRWLRARLEEALITDFEQSDGVAELLRQGENDVAAGTRDPGIVARELLERYRSG